ncbi:MAG: hypothetical protein WBB01_04260 [Phormidesmis sp.]
MSPVDYAAMSYRELRHYFLTHRDDNAAFQAYLARRRERSRPVITTLSDPDFDNKIQAAIRQQMTEYQTGSAG